MGYRSQVRIMTTEQEFKWLKEEVAKVVPEEDRWVLNNLDVELHKNDYVYFGWDYIKWYANCGSDKEIDAIDRLIEEEGHSTYFSFFRIGEDWDDVEERYSDEVPSIAIIRGFDDHNSKENMERGW